MRQRGPSAIRSGRAVDRRVGVMNVLSPSWAEFPHRLERHSAHLVGEKERNPAKLGLVRVGIRRALRMCRTSGDRPLWTETR